MTKLLTILLIALVVESVGVVFLSKGLKQIGEPARISVGEIARLVRKGITNPSLLLGIALEAAFFAALLYLLSQKDVSLIWPLTALGFVLTAISAKFILHETISPLRWAGVGLIVLGAALVSWSDVRKQLSGAPAPPAPEIKAPAAPPAPGP